MIRRVDTTATGRYREGVQLPEGVTVRNREHERLSQKGEVGAKEKA